MADAKISALPAATTPLAGTEVLPIVQSGSTVKVAVSNLTAGRSVSADSLALTTSLGIGTSSPLTLLSVGDSAAVTGLVPLGAVFSTNTSSGQTLIVKKSADTTAGSAMSLAKSRGTSTAPTAVSTGDTAGVLRFDAYGGTTWRGAASITSGVEAYTSDTNLSGYLAFATNSASTSATERMRINSSGNLLIGTTSATSGGGILQLSSGVTFPATQVASSNANTLDDYAEGTWTPADASGASLTFSSVTAKYTKIGNVVYINVALTYPTTTDTSQAQISGLPFAPAVGTTLLFCYPGVNANGAGQAWVSASSTTMTLVVQNNTAKTNANLSTLTIYMSGFYLV